MTTASITFTYNTEKHKALAEWLDKIEGSRSAAIREMLLKGLGKQADSPLEKILAEIQALRDNGHIVTEASGSTPAKAELDADIADHLRNLGK